MKYLEQRNAIIEACLWLEKTGMVIGTWGNVSVRLDDRTIMVTPSRVDYQEMQPEDLVIVDMEGNKVAGEYKPTSEMHVHRLIYIKRPDINAVVHSHSVYASAMCATGQSIPPFLEEIAQMIGGEISITDRYVDAGQHLALGEIAAETMGEKNAVLLRNHAPICAGRNLKEALVCCQVTEKAARCYLALQGGMDINVIPEEKVRSERHRFLFNYSKN